MACFITLEGGEGVGKSTQIQLIKQFLEKQGIDVVLSREPGGTALAEQIRSLLLQHHEEKISVQSELLLMFAARSQHIENVIKPAMQRGSWLVCDRFTDATYAYQGGGRGVDEQHLHWLKEYVQGGLQPDLTILLDAKVKTGLQRASKRAELDRFESEHLGFFETVRKAYLALAESDPQRIKVINAEQTIEQVQQDIEQLLISLIGK